MNLQDLLINVFTNLDIYEKETLYFNRFRFVLANSVGAGHSDQDLHCLPLKLHRLDILPHGTTKSHNFPKIISLM